MGNSVFRPNHQKPDMFSKYDQDESYLKLMVLQKKLHVRLLEKQAASYLYELES